MQAHKIPVFKPWVTEWVARSVIFAILLTSLFSFSFYGSAPAVIGFYGVQPTDVQYGMIVIYGSTVAFLALDFRIIKYFAPRKYLLMAIAANALCAVSCFYSRSWSLFIICQFVQGITCALMSGIMLQLTFPRLESTRARVIAYSLLYGTIQISVPFYSIYSSIVLYFYAFNWLFYGFAIILIALACSVLLTMNGRARFTKRIPLYQVDWIGYLFYVFFILTLGYILTYGRQLGWLDSPLITFLIWSDLLILILFVSRQYKLKRPLINLHIFQTKNFVIGLLLLFTFYIFKGSTGLAYSYLETILGNDPLSTIPIWCALIAGTVLSMSITSRFILMGYNLIRIILTGFGFMALFYVYMILFVSVQGDTAHFILPLFIYGVATGVLFVPIVTFTNSAAAPKIAANASLVGIFARFTGFTASLALNNEIQLFSRSAIREKVRETLIETSAQLPVTLLDIQNTYLQAGHDIATAKTATDSYFNRFLAQQILARATRDYYSLLLVVLILVIIILLCLPQVQKVVLRIKKGNIPY